MKPGLNVFWPLTESRFSTSVARRLREVEGRKLVVDCTGEGVVLVEADADVCMAELEAAGLRRPSPCMDQLLFDVEGSGGVLNSPLLLIQVYST